MAQVEIILPKMGESVAEATITSWLKNIGDTILIEDGILEIATDKVDTEVPCPYEGILIKQLYNVGEIVKVGKPFAIVETAQEVPEKVHTENLNEQEIAEDNKQNNVNPAIKTITKEHSDFSSLQKNSNQFYSPLVKSIAKSEALSIDELNAIPSSGKNGRLTKYDLLNFLEQRKTVSTSKPVSFSEINAAAATTPAKSLSGENEIIQMDRMRKLIADNMLRSKQISPHVSSIVEIDVTNLVRWRNKVKDEFEKKEGFKLTYTPIFIEAIAKALRDFPMVNISIDGDKIILKKDINIGVAVALPSGNLIVPVVKNADQLNLIGIAKRSNELSIKAKNNKLSPDDIQNGTFTLTNIGTFGNEIGTPIINQPQVAILSTGIIKKKPAVIETPSGDFIGIRQLMFLSMSYDHRVVDGMLGGSFLKKVADYLEYFDFNRQIW